MWPAHPADRPSTHVICQSTAVEHLHSVRQISTWWMASRAQIMQHSALRAVARHLTTSANSFLAQVLLIVLIFISLYWVIICHFLSVRKRSTFKWHNVVSNFIQSLFCKWFFFSFFFSPPVSLAFQRQLKQMISALVMLILLAMRLGTVDTLGLIRNLVKSSEYLISFSSDKACMFYIIKKYRWCR